jgi:tRNA A-37 threonylcarbamoyl transferase component Bud32
MSLLDHAAEPLSLRVIETAHGFSAAEVTLELGAALRVLPERREVYFGLLLGAEGRSVVAKRFLPHPKQARDWRREWAALIALQGLKLSAPIPVCVAEESDGKACWVIMDRIDGAVSVEHTFLQADTVGREAMMCRLVELVDDTHRQGVWQGDQHIDNWTWDGERFYLLDAATIRFQQHSLDVRQRQSDLAGICVTLPPAAERLFRARLQSNYLAEDPDKRQRTLDELEPVIVGLQRERIRRYYKKTRRNCTEFRCLARTDTRCIHARGTDASLIERFAADPDSFMRKGVCLKAGNTCTVQGFTFAGTRYVLKRYNQKPLFDRLRHVFSDSRALQSWSTSWVLEMAFIPTARAVAVCEDRRKRLSGCRYLLMERIEGQLLTDYVDAHAGDAERLEAVAVAFARLWASLGRLCAAHGDLKATNLIVGEDGVLYLFDLDAFRFGLRGAALERGRTRDWNRFFKNWKENPGVERLFKQELERLQLT